jgi:mono/diheme cytochrome c family protein
MRPLLTVLALTLVTATGSATGTADDPTTANGVYTRRQADAGQNLFALACQSCHAPTQHAGADFRGRWFGRSLGELFGYLRREMPQTDPGTLSDEEYTAVIAYLMRINRMPAGDRPLAADSAALHRIRIDSIPSAPVSHSDNR